MFQRPGTLGVVALLALLAACQNEPSSVPAEQIPRASSSLGLPHRVLEPGTDGTFTDVVAVAIDLTGRTRIPGELSARATPDSLSLVMKGQPVRLVTTMPPHEGRDVVGIRLGYRGTLGGRLGLSWREAREPHFRRALVGVDVPGGGELVSCQLGFGPTRILGRHVSGVGIELPSSEVGTVTLQRIELVLEPGASTHRVDIDGDVREVLAPGPRRRMEWDVVVPTAGRLAFDYATHPDMRVSHGDGTRFVAEVVDGTKSTTLLDRWLSVFAVPGHRPWQSADLDLAAWAGRRVTLRLTTLAGPDAHGVFPASAEVGDDDPLFTVPRLVVAGDARPNVLVIVIDTLRRDALGVWGGGPSPVLDSLATAATRYDRAWSSGSWTHPSVASLLSGWNPSRHGLGFGPAGTTRRDPRTPMLAVDLRAVGYATAAISNNRIVSVEEGFAEGFTTFDQTAFVEDQVYGAQRVTRSALAWSAEHRESPWFLYLHYFDPHDRYQAPPPFTRMHVAPRLESTIRDSSVRGGRPNTFMDESPAKRDLTADELEYMRDLYRGEVSYLDHWIGRLLDGLRASGALDNTLVVLTSDHGEEFLEHGGFKHGHSLYEELVAVPLIVARPGGHSAGTVVDSPVTLLDLAPTVRDVAGVEPRTDGRPWPLATRDEDIPVAENFRDGEGPLAGVQRAVLQWPRKLIEYGDGARLELFDLAADPRERAPLGEAEEVGRMVAVLDSVAGDSAPAVEDAEVDPALLEKLKAMGYVH